VAPLPFDMGLMELLAAHRHPVLSAIFQFFTFLGEVEGYVLLVALVYCAWDKRLGVQLALVTLVAMTLNHFLKTLIANPRPFVAEATWAQKWAVSPARAAELVTEYSTPSGHAMSAGAFYTWLFARVPRRGVRSACVLLLLLVGLSRPYLGVHYLEDVLLGWALGAAVAALALRNAAAIRRAWERLSHARQIGLAVGVSLALWGLTRSLAGWSTLGQPTAFVSYTGFLTGIVVAAPLEPRHVGFDPRSGSALHKLLRYLLGIGLVIGTMLGLDTLFEAVAADATPLGDLLRFVRYGSVAIVALLAAPVLFLKLGLAEREQEGASSG
jgi:membrane-associated phospholipid phosphatase